jgi:hypothetical protein
MQAGAEEASELLQELLHSSRRRGGHQSQWHGAADGDADVGDAAAAAADDMALGVGDVSDDLVAGVTHSADAQHHDEREAATDASPTDAVDNVRQLSSIVDQLRKAAAFSLDTSRDADAPSVLLDLDAALSDRAAAPADRALHLRAGSAAAHDSVDSPGGGGGHAVPSGARDGGGSDAVDAGGGASAAAAVTGANSGRGFGDGDGGGGVALGEGVADGAVMAGDADAVDHRVELEGGDRPRTGSLGDGTLCRLHCDANRVAHYADVTGRCGAMLPRVGADFGVEEDDDAADGSALKKRKVMCSLCHSEGHNKRSCLSAHGLWRGGNDDATTV